MGPQENTNRAPCNPTGTEPILARDAKFWGKGFPPGQASGFAPLRATHEHELRNEGEGFMHLLDLE